MNELLFEYKVKVSHGLDLKEFSFYATTEIEEFLNRNSIDYVRNCTDTAESRLFKENKKLNNIIKNIDTYIHLWELDEIGEKTMLILNDILLIKNGMSDKVIRLKGVNKE